MLNYHKYIKFYKGVKKLKKIRNRQFIFQTITSLAFSLAVVAANTRCAYIYHQPKKPEELKTLRK